MARQIGRTFVTAKRQKASRMRSSIGLPKLKPPEVVALFFYC
jgi:hypothetical protein